MSKSDKQIQAAKRDRTTKVALKGAIKPTVKVPRPKVKGRG